MYVCICNALTDKRLAQAVSQGHTKVSDVYAACDCRAQCGKCAFAILRLLREHAICRHEEPVGA